jgi:inorganic pyrophosphatase
MRDKGVPDDKILAVPATDPLFDEMRKLADIPAHYLEEVTHFFTVYKDLQHVRVEAMGWEEREIAGQEIERAINLYAQSLRTHR